MYYQVSQEFFDKLPNACFGAVAVRGLDNTHDIPELEQMLAEQGGCQLTCQFCDAVYDFSADDLRALIAGL